ncbi:Interferon- developmental regulator 1 [Dimargaris cristalligena]|uniref:Interferon-related developmental regulator-domain-containing protein n=1 Tax=Dimargaris cristalligena TaxID=215637 RepID=A0A4P9ZUV2_9FUNG|nr:Interferon- developmental regulator 1 [Dimargaris cristalligena]RKP36592.1 interferon-related developmental regulator-domain-containing protein [Dimargaris cristalligena]|eukprot:RKP36592.1 interferon-related developmental regulator-domain-containing protein [Dimargaris cristalligena]
MSLMRQSLRAALSQKGGPIKGLPGSRKSTPAASRQGSDAEGSDDDHLDSDSDTSLATDDFILNGHADGSLGGPPLLGSGDDTFEELVRDNIDKLTEKRASTREEALQWLIRAMALRYAADALESSQETFLDALRRAVRAGKSSRETLLAARGIALWFVTLGADQEQAYEDLSTLLRPLIKSVRNPATKAQCILSLAVACFIACQDVFATADLCRYLLPIIASPKETPEVLESALVSLGLLVSALNGAPSLAGKIFNEVIGPLAKCLGSDQVQVRIASGQTIALLYAMLRYRSGESDHPAAWDDAPLVDQLHALVADSSRRRSKKERAAQKAALRQVLRTVEDGDDPSLTFKTKYGTLVFDDWIQIHRLQVFRLVLNEGLLNHFQENDLLQDIFGTAFSDLALHTGPTERVVHSPRSQVAKERTLRKTKQRDIRYQANYSMDE